MRKARLCAAALALCLGAGGFFAYAENGDSREMEQAKNQISILEEEKARTEETLKNLETLKTDTEQYVRSLDESLNQLNLQLSQLDGQIRQKEQEIGEAEAALEAAKERERGQYESMKLRIKYMYEAGETTFLDLILQSENLGQMLNRAEYVNQITRYDRQMLEEYRRSRDQVAGQRRIPCSA